MIWQRSLQRVIGGHLLSMATAYDPRGSLVKEHQVSRETGSSGSTRETSPPARETTSSGRLGRCPRRSATETSQTKPNSPRLGLRTVWPTADHRDNARAGPSTSDVACLRTREVARLPSQQADEVDINREEGSTFNQPISIACANISMLGSAQSRSRGRR